MSKALAHEIMTSVAISSDEHSCVRFYDRQSHGKAKEVGNHLKIRLAEWAKHPDATHALALEKIEKHWSPVEQKDVELVMVTHAWFFTNTAAMEAQAKTIVAQKLPTGHRNQITRFEWDLGINLME